MPEVTSREFEMSDPGTLSISQLKVSLIVVEAGKLIGVAVEPRNMRQRPEVDSGGYDLALEFRGLTRHMQLKSSYRGARRSEVTAHVKLLDRPSSCILWIFFDADTLWLGPFLWFGGFPGERIPPFGEKIARHTKPNAKLEKADRPAHRVIPKSRFATLDTIEDVIQKLIGV